MWSGSSAVLGAANLHTCLGKTQNINLKSKGNQLIQAYERTHHHPDSWGAQVTEDKKRRKTFGVCGFAPLRHMRQLCTTPLCDYSVSGWGFSIQLWLLPIKEIRLKMFQHEGKPAKPILGLLFPSKTRAKPHSLAAQASKRGGQSHASLEWNLVSTRAHQQQGEDPVWACSDLHETTTCLLLYSTFRRVAHSYWITICFLFLPVFHCHAVLIRAHQGQVCLPPPLVPLWNGQLVEMPKWSGSRSWCGYCYRATNLCPRLLQF